MFILRPIALALAPLFAITAQPALAQDGVLSITSEVEKLVPQGEGKAPLKTYVDTKVVVPGDRIRYTLTFRNNGAQPATGIRLVNPIPENIQFDQAITTEDFSVSIDGGKTFGALADATVPVLDAAPRAATSADVTHVRWLLSRPVAGGQSHAVSFFGRVK